MKQLTVAFVASEMEPYAKTGGLADVVGALPAALGRLGVRVHVFLPRYSGITAPDGDSPARNVSVHFIEHDGYFRRPGLYGGPEGDYWDNLDRFAFFCREVFRRMRAGGLRPDVLHAHDWQAALSVVYLRHLFGDDPLFAKTGSVFTVHNLAYQGVFARDWYHRLVLPWTLYHMEGLEYYGKINLLKGGLVFADAITAVSPSYAREIQTPQFGEGLDGVLRNRSEALFGILNGIDRKAWNPAADKALPARYDAKGLPLKAKVKAALQKELGLPADPKAFLLGVVNRFAAQKGVDLIVQALPKMLRGKSQLAVLGSGDRPIEQSLVQAASASRAARVRVGFDQGLARRIYAGADAFLMPSRYEPCGLGQMIAMRYGTPPIVRRTGGLADTVADCDAASKRGTGFTFGPAEPAALAEAVARAQRAYRQPARWRALQRRCMEADFSWGRSAKEYVRVYERVRRA